jgi:hypothetical protein
MYMEIKSLVIIIWRVVLTCVLVVFMNMKSWEPRSLGVRRKALVIPSSIKIQADGFPCPLPVITEN